MKKISLSAIIAFSVGLSQASQAAVNVTWKDTNIGKMVIEECGTYRIEGTVKGTILVSNKVTCPVKITGPGTLNDVNNIDQVNVIKSSKNTPIEVNGLTVILDNGHKAIDLPAEGSRIINCTFTGIADRSKTAGHIQPGKNGLIKNTTGKIYDDTFKVKPVGSTVKNSTAILQGNGSAVTIDWGGADGDGHFANNITVSGKLGPNTSDTSPRSGRTVLGASSRNNASKMHYKNITIRDGKNMASIVKIQALENGSVKNVVMTGSLPDGVKRHRDDVSPVILNAFNGNINNVTVDFGGALSDKSYLFKQGSVSNYSIR